MFIVGSHSSTGHTGIGAGSQVRSGVMALA